jgi:predicted Zn-dependent protease
MTGIDAIREALEHGDRELVLRLSQAELAERPGNDAAHELRARALLALGRAEEAEEHAQAAVRLDPDEIRYRELLAEVLSAVGAHRDAAAEFGRLARNDPRQPEWLLAEAGERLDAAQAAQGVDAARAAVRLDPRNGRAQLTLAQALLRTGDARGAYQAAGAALRLLGNALDARETLADARWLAGRRDEAFDDYRALARELADADRERVVDKARRLYLQDAGWAGRLLGRVPPVFALAMRAGWLHVDK